MSCSRPMICFYGKYGRHLRWSDISFPRIIKFTEIHKIPDNGLFRSLDDIEKYAHKHNDKPIMLPFDKISYCVDYFKNMINTCVKTEYDKWAEAFNIGDLSMVYDIFSLYRYFKNSCGSVTSVSCIDEHEYLYMNELYEDANVIINTDNYTHAICNTLHLHDSIEHLVECVGRTCVDIDVTYVFNVFEGDSSGNITYSNVFGRKMLNFDIHEYVNFLKPLFGNIVVFGGLLICNDRKGVANGECCRQDNWYC